MARRSVYRLLGGFDEGLRRHEDTDFNLRLALAGGHFAGLSRPLVRQTVTITGDKSAREERRHALKTIEKHRELLERWGWYDYALAWWDVKFTHIEDGALRALPKLARLFVRSPVKTVRKIAWTLPNRGEYKRYRYPGRTGGD
jgi:GT2 family glycosyltransferase